MLDVNTELELIQSKARRMGQQPAASTLWREEVAAALGGSQARARQTGHELTHLPADLQRGYEEFLIDIQPEPWENEQFRDDIV